MPWPMARRVAASPNGMTSTGSGKRPSVSTHLVSSAITIMRSDALATIFSRSSAPPPPLIRLSAASISSAPSTVRSSRSTSSSVVSGMPHCSAWMRVASEVGTPTTLQPGAHASRPTGRRNASRSNRCRARASCRRAPPRARAPPPAVSDRPYSRAEVLVGTARSADRAGPAGACLASFYRPRNSAIRRARPYGMRCSLLARSRADR